MTDRAVPADDPDGYDDDPEEDDQGAALLDLAVTTLAGAVTGIVGYTAGGPTGAMISNTGTPFLAAVFRKMVRPFWDDQSRKADMMLETAAETAGVTREQLADRAAESEQTRFLTDKAIQAAADTIWPAGVRAIGRAYAAGLLAKDKPVLDIRLRVLGIMEDLDELHVSLLGLLVKYEPDAKYGEGWVAVPQSFPSYVDMYGGGERPDNPKVWSAGRRSWTIQQIIGVMPHLQPVLASLLGELQQRGLIQENDTAPATVKRLGNDLAKQMNGQAGQMQRSGKVGPIRIQEPSVNALNPNWSPTELGEKILGFYAEAGAEDSQDPGGYPGKLLLDDQEHH